MRKIILLLILFSNSFALSAQVLINIQLPQSGVHMNSQLWNMTLINVGNYSSDVRIDMLLSEAGSGLPILSASTKEFNLPFGTKQIQIAEISPIIYNVLNAQYNVSSGPEGFLPIGNFIVCYGLYRRTSESFEKIAEECESILIEPSSPPILIYPEDESKIDQNRPMLTWLPPSPTFLFGDLSYELTLVEVLDNQNTSEAVQNNFPLIQEYYINSNFFNYPVSISPLDTGRLYAWRVKALSNMQPVANTEIFSFSLMSETEKINKQMPIYSLLKRMDEVSFTICKGELFYEYLNAENSDTLRIELWDITTQNNLEISLPNQELPIAYGQNFLRLDLRETPAVKNNHIYKLIGSNKEGKKSALKFIYKTEE